MHTSSVELFPSVAEPETY